MKQISLAIAILIAITSEADAQLNADSIAYYEQQGLQAYEKGNYEQAEILYLKITESTRQTNFPKYLEVLNNLGNIVAYSGKSEAAIGYYQEALRNIDKSDNRVEFEAKILKNIGATYSDLKDFKNASSYLNRAEVIAKKTGNNELIADCLNNRGIIYEQIDSVFKALDMYIQARTFYQRLGNPERLALVFINIGVISKNLEQWDVAKNSCDSALYYSRLIGNEFYISATLNNLGNVYAGKKRYDEAIKVTTEALEISRKIGQPDLEQNCLSSLAEQFHAKGDNKNAYIWQQQFLTLHDSIINIERVIALTEMETRFDVEKKELELDRLSAENQLIEAENEHAVLNQLLLASLLFCVIAGSLAIVRIRNLRHKRKQLEVIAITEKQERERIAKDMHDELGSGISRITWITASVAQTVADEKQKSQISLIESIADQLSTGMKSLIWLLNSGNVEWEVLSGRVREMASQLCEEFEINLKFGQSGLEKNPVIKQNAARDIFLICKESLNNSVKYSNARRIEIKFEYKNDQFVLVIADNGLGFDQSTIQRGHGLNNIERRCKDLGGYAELNTTPDSGTKWNITLPINSVIHGNRETILRENRVSLP